MSFIKELIAWVFYQSYYQKEEHFKRIEKEDKKQRVIEPI